MLSGGCWLFTLPFMGKGLQNFKRFELPQATRCIVLVAHQANKNLIGVRPVVLGKHEYSVHRRLIVEINHQPIVSCTYVVQGEFSSLSFASQGVGFQHRSKSKAAYCPTRCGD